MASAVKALDELGLVDASHKADAVAKVGEVGQVGVTAGGVHLHRCAHHRDQPQVTSPAPQAAWEGHGGTLHPPQPQRLRRVSFSKLFALTAKDMGARQGDVDQIALHSALQSALQATLQIALQNASQTARQSACFLWRVPSPAQVDHAAEKKAWVSMSCSARQACDTYETDGLQA